MTKLIDFWASWCGPCRIMNPIIEELEVELKGRVEFSKVNVDEDQETAQKYGVLSIPTYVIENDGKEVDRLIGARGKEAFKSWLESHLAG